jgi:hypothetical protein
MITQRGNVYTQPNSGPVYPVIKYVTEGVAKELALIVAIKMLDPVGFGQISEENVVRTQTILAIDLTEVYGKQEYEQHRAQLLECPSMIDHTRASTLQCMNSWQNLLAIPPMSQYYVDILNSPLDETSPRVEISKTLDNGAYFTCQIQLKSFSGRFMLRHRPLDAFNKESVQEDWLDYALVCEINSRATATIEERKAALQRLDKEEYILNNEWRNPQVQDNGLFRNYHNVVEVVAESIMLRTDFFTFVGKYLDKQHT